jgi:hypothetical protein
LSWLTAFHDLQTALNTASFDRIIRVAQGTYRPTEGTDREAFFAILAEDQIYGSYAGVKAINQGLDPDVRNFAHTASILSGDIGQQNYLFDNSYHVVFIGAVDTDTILDGFRITLGCADGTVGGPGYGGGILMTNMARPIIRHCAIEDNFAHINGGGVAFVEGASPTFLNCNISTNFGNVRGGGMYLKDSTVTIKNSTLTCNQSFEGGAIFADHSTLDISNSVIWGNLVSSGNGSTAFGFANMGGTPYGTISYSDLDQTFPGINVSNVNVDPKFVTMPGPGSGGWGTGDETLGNLRLRSNSPLIDAGSNALVDPTVTADLASVTRIIGNAVDIGAYEFTRKTTLVGGGGGIGVEDEIFWRGNVSNPWPQATARSDVVELLSNIGDDVLYQ